MNRTSPSSRLVSSAARSPDLAITGPGGGAEADAHLAREDLGERRLAEPRRAVEQHMVERFAAALRGVDEHPQILARRLLPDELVEASWAEAPRRRPRLVRSGVVIRAGSVAIAARESSRISAYAHARGARDVTECRRHDRDDTPRDDAHSSRVGQCFQSMCSTPSRRSDPVGFAPQPRSRRQDMGSSNAPSGIAT